MTQLAAIHNLPQHRNPFFTGREDVLSYLQMTLMNGEAVALTQALSGLGGIGKTQTALEYAYRYHYNYQAVFWINAASHETCITSFFSLADLLHLPEKDEKDQQRMVVAVLRWLREHEGWLVVYDNADNLEDVVGFIPTASRGHILITTRAHALGELAQSVELEKMSLDTGSLLLLRRAGIISLSALLKDASTHEQFTSQEIVRTLDGLPLALDQAGAYIKETGCGLSKYLSLYHDQQYHLLGKNDALGIQMYFASVATTWSLSFERVTQANKAAEDFLHVCAFLAPEAIPEEIFAEGASRLGPLLESVSSDKLALNALFKELLRFSLLYRDADNQNFTIHRLVQAVIKDSMPEETQQIFAERTVLAVSQAFPYVDFTEWLEYAKRWQRCLPHALVCVNLIKQWNFKDPSVGNLLHNVGYYIKESGRDLEAEHFLLQALAVRESLLGVNHPDVGHTLNVLALSYRMQGKYAEAEALYLKTLGIWKQTFGDQTSQVATCLSNIATMYTDQGRHIEAEKFCKQSLAIRERILGTNDPEVAYNLTTLGHIYREQNKYKMAKKVYLRALSIREEMLGSEHPTVALTLSGLGLLCFNQGEYLDAKTYILKALQIEEKNLGQEHPNIAGAYNLLGLISYEQRDFIQAESCYLRASLIYKNLGLSQHFALGFSHNLARLYHAQGKYSEAEQLYLQALSLWEQTSLQLYWFGALLRQNLAGLCYDQGKYSEAEQLYLQALSLWEQNHIWHRRNYTKFIDCLNALAKFYISQNNLSKAETLYEQALETSERVLGKEHPYVASILESLASLLQRTQRKMKASRLAHRAQAIRARQDT